MNRGLDIRVEKKGVTSVIRVAKVPERKRLDDLSAKQVPTLTDRELMEEVLLRLRLGGTVQK
jgi:hypothetical protein